MILLKITTRKRGVDETYPWEAIAEFDDAPKPNLRVAHVGITEADALRKLNELLQWGGYVE